jgi:hypothetical protein
LKIQFPEIMIWVLAVQLSASDVNGAPGRLGAGRAFCCALNSKSVLVMMPGAGLPALASIAGSVT